ncbi:hypothetical protein D869_gp038 [Caulobacter phage CcrRogue]|uniref:Uncharacterized protein n=1 Tax=Caulobacter phage CcrRogue TaxID=2927986 RepID=K4JQH2_9CAUD|nr:hypothetical protein D869_gp038 [Caulobacter phage CcrRogue]AFU86520.1 hypothetical protein CcrRogue_gp038 [Caulobacter phage CcrRogue]
MTDIYARIMASPPTGSCDMCKTAPAIRWFGQSSVAHCGAQACIDACNAQARETLARIEREQQPQEES